MPRIGIGVIGTGGIACGTHIPQIGASEDLHLSAICDIDPERLRAVGDAQRIPENRRFNDYRKLIDCPDAHAIDICTPNDVHFEIAMAAAAAGKPFSLEKPVALDATQASALYDRAQATGVQAMICFSYRYRPHVRMLKQLIDDGAIGSVYHANMQYAQAWAMPERNRALVWRFSKARAGSGALGDLGCHALDIVRFVTGLEYESVVADADTWVKRRERLDGVGQGEVDVDDYCNYLARMSGGAAASFQITRFAYGRGNYQRLEIYGRKGTLVYVQDEEQGKDRLDACIGEPMGKLCHFTRLPVQDSLGKSQAQAFADILLGKGDGMNATLWDGMVNQRAVDAVLASYEHGRWERV